MPSLVPSSPYGHGGCDALSAVTCGAEEGVPPDDGAGELRHAEDEHDAGDEAVPGLGGHVPQAVVGGREDAGAWDLGDPGEKYGDEAEGEDEPDQ